MFWCLCILYHQTVTAGLQSAETDAEQDRCGEGVVVDEATALRITVATIQGQICVGVAREEHGAKVDLQGDGLNPAVNTDVPLTWRNRVEGRQKEGLTMPILKNSGLQSQDPFHKSNLRALLVSFPTDCHLDWRHIF